jgi:hypothetical protein
MGGKFITILCNTDAIKKKTATLRSKLNPAQFDSVMRAKAEEIKTYMYTNTPVGKISRKGGPTREGWIIRQNKVASYSVRNYKKTMLYLELGTKSPIVPKASNPRGLLYIPLTQAGYDSYMKNRAYQSKVRKAERRGKTPPAGPRRVGLKRGFDYVFAKSVSGKTPLNLRKKISPSITNIFIKKYLKTVGQSLKG